MLGDNRSAIAVLPDLERGAPFAAPTDGDGVRRRSDCVLVQDLAHLRLPWLEPLIREQRRPFGSRRGPRLSPEHAALAGCGGERLSR